MKKITFFLVAVLLNVSAMATVWTSAGATATGFGTQLPNAGKTEANPIIITTPEQWMYAAGLANGASTPVVITADTMRAKCFALGDNLDFNTLAGAKTFGQLTAGAVFDGKGFTISNIILDGTKLATPAAQALFTTVNTATVKNLGLTGSGSITGLSGSAGIACTATLSTISNCYNTTNVSGDIVSTPSANTKAFNIGGIVGQSTNSTIQDCHNTGTITGAGRCAGIAAIVGGTSNLITRCYNTGAVNGVFLNTTTGTNYGDSGGILGYAGVAVTVESCYNTGSINVGVGGSTGNSYVGGIVGSSIATAASINNCYNTGSVTLATSTAYPNAASAGGIIGSTAAAITNCYNTGTITNTKTPTNNGLGGIIGFNTARGIPTNCYTLAGTGYNDGVTLGAAISTTVIKDILGLQDPAFITTLNNGQNPVKWKVDNTPQTNNGYPILTFAIATGLNPVYQNEVVVSVKDKAIQLLNDVSSIEVYNVIGACLINKQNLAVSSVITMPHAGVYLIKVKTDKGISVQKILIQ